MVERENKNVEVLKKFKKKIKKFGVDKIILFGSRAGGNFRKDSDFDILVVSKKFEGKRWNERPLEIYLSWDEKEPLEILCYTPEEFNRGKKELGIVQEALKEGIEI